MNEAPQFPFDDSPFANPYASPQFSQPATARLVEDELPTFPKVVAIVDLVFCAIRALMIVAAVVNILSRAGREDELIATTGWLEVISGTGILAFGTIAAIGILSKADWAVPFGWIAVVFTVASTGVGMWQASIVLRNIPADVPDRDLFVTGTIVGVAGAAIVRVALLVMYVFALRSFAAWRWRRSRTAFR